AQHHVGRAIAVEVAEAGGLPGQSDRTQAGGVGDVVVADVVNLEGARIAVAQHHVGRIAAVEAAETVKPPIGPDLAQGVTRQDRVVADVVDLVEAVGTVAHDHVGGGAGGGRRVRLQGRDEAVLVAVAIVVGPDDLARGVDAVYKGVAAGRGLVERGVDAAAVNETVGAAAVVVIPDDLAHGVDAAGSGAFGAQRVVEGGVSVVVRVVEEAVDAAFGVAGIVTPHDQAGVVDAIRIGAVRGRGIVEGDVAGK